ncbi:polysaccharide deacetylase family protein [Candidatus Parcubacteria bacterium]|nr:polysaccharide deacetylase family protein [Candidatus Parcubacteria bacterium]
MERHITKIKIFFTVSMAIWMVLVVATTKNRVLEKQVARAERQTQYMRYKFEFSRGQNLPTLASVGALIASVFKEPESAISAEATSSALRAEAVPILLYHGIVSKPDRFSLTPEAFKEQMFALKREGYETVRLDDFIQFVRGEKDLPEKSFLLAFDDGRVDSFEEADPILQALGWSSVMFVATRQSFPETGINEYYLNKNQVADMAKSGRWEIQSHAVQLTGGAIEVDKLGNRGNLLSNKMWLTDLGRLESEEEYIQRIDNEFTLSKQAIERLLGTSVRAFAYPFGDYGQDSENAKGLAEETIRGAVTKNYEVAFQQTWDKDNFFSENFRGLEPDFYRLRRVEPASTWSGDDLLAFLKGAASKMLSYSDLLTANNGWKNPWGAMEFNGQGLHLMTSPETTGSFAFLDGTRGWTDYLYTAKIEKEKGDYVTLFARYQNDDNYVSCTFGDRYVKIDEKEDGVLHTLIEDENPIHTPPEGAYYGIYVNGSEVKCYEGGAVAVLSFGFDDKLSSGGIGVRIWDEALNNGAIILSSLQVVPSNEANSVLDALPLYNR